MNITRGHLNSLKPSHYFNAIQYTFLGTTASRACLTLYNNNSVQRRQPATTTFFYSVTSTIYSGRDFLYLIIEGLVVKEALFRWWAKVSGNKTKDIVLLQMEPRRAAICGPREKVASWSIGICRSTLVLSCSKALVQRYSSMYHKHSHLAVRSVSIGRNGIKGQ